MTAPVYEAKYELMLLCPVCSEPLRAQERLYDCPQGHRFDIAREGYVNLLRLKRRPKIIGDSKEMLRARRAFLDRGHYSPLYAAINRRVREHLQTLSAQNNLSAVSYTIIDVGCGEGSYLYQLENALRDTQVPVRYLGMDIAKDGPRLAAKRASSARYFVADVKQPLLVPARSADCILNIFAPRNPAEFARILRPQGLLLTVIPDPNHLIELRSRYNLLNIQAAKEDQLCSQLSGTGLNVVNAETVAFEMRLEPDSIDMLLTMTPNHRHLNRETNAGVETLTEPTSVTASFRLLTFQHKQVENKNT